MDPEELLNSILNKKGIRTVFQPIISLETGDVFGYEALSRITISNCGMNIEQLFELAFKFNKLWELEQLCRTRALESAKAQCICKSLFLNVDANIIHDPEFKAGFTCEKLNQYGLAPENIIFEITEKSAISDMKTFVASISHYQNQNFQIAIDDFGSGHSGLNRVCAFSPQYLKIDMNLIRNIESDSVKRSAVSAIVQFCKQINIAVIAEGIETKEELKALIRMGIDLGQGYYLGRPNDKCYESDEETASEIRKNHDKAKNLYSPSIFSKIIELAEKKETVHLYDNSKEIFERINQGTLISEFFVLDDEERVCGILTRSHLLEKFSGQYGYVLSSRTVASELMMKNHLFVDEALPVDQVVELAMNRMEDCIYDAIAVVKNGCYAGTVTVKDLLLASVRLQVQRAADSNPLTGLPGNNQIQQVISNIFRRETEWSIIYFDLDNFKAYNDAYGFSNGDLMLKALANVLGSCCEKNDFCGHIGGDDFVVVLYSHDIRMFCDNVCKKFSESIESLYSSFDWNRGFITSKNRHGFVENFAIATLSIAAVTNEKVHPCTMEELSLIIADAKKRCKQKEGNSVVIV